MTNPREVPAAGGCSVLVTTIAKILKPTDRAAARSMMCLELSVCAATSGIFKSNAINAPTSAATICPPITFLGVAATLFGNTNTVNADDATPTTMAPFIRESPTNKMINNDKVASPH